MRKEKFEINKTFYVYNDVCLYIPVTFNSKKQAKYINRLVIKIIAKF